MASLDSLEPRTTGEAADYLRERAQRRLDGNKQVWSVRDAHAVKKLTRYVRTRVERDR